MRKYNHVDQKEFELTKQLASAGLKPAKIRIVTGRSRVSIGRMLKASTLDEYLRELSEYRAKQVGKKSVDQMSVSVLDTDVSVNVPELLRKIATYLEKEKNV